MAKNIFYEALPNISPGIVVHEWTKNFRDGMVFEGRDDFRPDAWLDQVAPVTPAESLMTEDDPFATNKHSVIDTLVRRRSIRRYEDIPFTREHLGQLLTLVYPPEVVAQGYEPDHKPHSTLNRRANHVSSCKIVTLALNVEGLTRGAYIYDEYRRALRHLRIEDPTQLVHDKVFQAEFTAAPVIFLIAGSLASNLKRYGDRGYRYMLMDAGVMIQRLYMVSSYLELSSCVTGSIMHDDFSKWLGFDGYNAAVLTAFVVGHRPTEYNMESSEEVTNG